MLIFPPPPHHRNITERVEDIFCFAIRGGSTSSSSSSSSSSSRDDIFATLPLGVLGLCRRRGALGLLGGARKGVLGRDAKSGHGSNAKFRIEDVVTLPAVQMMGKSATETSDLIRNHKNSHTHLSSWIAN
uniref:Uncharacterized protein n=1 Tax=Oryza glumipatula TaxID=40148 RepID=A0A0E0BHA3_9ORYZ